MPILSQKEYAEFKETQKRKNEVLDISEEKVIKEGASPPSNNKLWYLLHPENGQGDYLNFEDVLNIDGENYKRICKNGVVKTSEEPLAEFLIKKGYQILEVVPLETKTEDKNWINELKV